MNRPLRFALCCALSVLASAGANAADLGVQPVYKAVQPAAPLSYDWRGFYVGGHVGGVNAKVDSTTIDIATGIGTGISAVSPSNVLGGGQVGYNFMVAPNWLIGVEADISGTNLRGRGIE